MFFGDRIPADELEFLATAIQGIADAFFHQKQEGNLVENAAELSNAIIDYSLRLLGYSPAEIRRTIKITEEYIQNKRITTDKYFKSDMHERR